MGFVQRRLPWLIAAGAMVVYFITLNHSATFDGISSLAKAAGWEWRPNILAPLHVIATYPVRWLPTGLQLVSLNLLAAACASIALGLLARSVALLPHDRTREQRAQEKSDYSMLTIRAAWLPPVLAVLVCGFQLSFWQNAVVATGEALDLLIFAWLIHTLLQYRIDAKEFRLTIFAFVYGLAVVNNYAMVAFFVPFAIAMLWIKGLGFFNWRFMLRMLGCGLAGLSLYVLLPAIEAASNPSGHTFWELLRSHWGNQKDTLLTMPRYIVAITCFTSLLPVLFMGIRWPAHFGEISAVGNALTNLMTYLIHGGFLLACIYVAFDPPFSPRSLGGGMFAFLPLYFLGALAIGYCSGYFLLVFGAKPGSQAWQRPTAFRRFVNRSVVALVWVSLLAAPAGLLYRNLPVIWASTGEAMDRLSQAVVKSLPEQGAVVLSDNLFQLFSLKYELEKSNPNHKHILVDTASLVAPGYHRFLRKAHADRWPKFTTDPDPKVTLSPVSLIQILYQLSTTETLCYLQPSFGYYFEFFHAKPRQMVYELKLYPTNTISAPLLTADEFKAQDAYWRALKTQEFDPLIQKATPFVKPRMGKYTPKPRTLESFLGETYSRMLNHFGVQAQRFGDMAAAGDYFEWSLQLNPANPAAFLNRDFNRAWRETKRAPEKPSEGTMDRLSLYGGAWDAILGTSGPVDDPTACFLLGRALEQSGNFRQAAQNLERTIFYTPENRAAQIVSILLHVKAQLPDVALQKAAAFRARHPVATLSDEEEIELVRAEAWAYATKNDLPTAERLLNNLASRFPQQSAPWDTLVDMYSRLGQQTNALAAISRQLQVQPDNLRALINAGAMSLNLGKFNEAIPFLDRALRISPSDETALYNRAVANEKIDRLDDARRDYESLLKIAKSNFRIAAFYKLGEIHFRKKDNKESLRYFKEFLKAAPEGTPEIPLARARVKLIESGGSL